MEFSAIDTVVAVATASRPRLRMDIPRRRRRTGTGTMVIRRHHQPLMDILMDLRKVRTTYIYLNFVNERKRRMEILFTVESNTIVAK